MSTAKLVLKSLFKYQVFSFKYYFTRRWQKLVHNREAWNQISNVYLIKIVLADCTYIVNSCPKPAISPPSKYPPSPRQSPACRIGYYILRYIFGSVASSSRLIEMYPFANPGYQLAHEVTSSVILRKCISKSFFPLSWLPGSVFF